MSFSACARLIIDETIAEPSELLSTPAISDRSVLSMLTGMVRLRRGGFLAGHGPWATLDVVVEAGLQGLRLRPPGEILHGPGDRAEAVRLVVEQ